MERDNNDNDDDDRKMPALPFTNISSSSSCTFSSLSHHKFMMLTSLPDDQYQQVVSHLDLTELMNLSLTSHFMRQLVNTTRHLDTMAPSSSPLYRRKKKKRTEEFRYGNPCIDYFNNMQKNNSSDDNGGAIPPSNTAEYSMSALESSLTAAIANTRADTPTSGGASNGNVAAAARLLLEPAEEDAAENGGLGTLRDIFRDSYAAAFSARTTQNSTSNNHSNNNNKRDDSALIHQLLYGTTIMTEHRLTTILSRFTSLTDLTIRGLSAMGDSFLPLLNNSAAAPNLIRLRLFDCRIVQNKSGVGLQLQQQQQHENNDEEKLKTLVMTGTIFIPYKNKALKSFVSSKNLHHITMRGCRAFTNDDFHDLTTQQGLKKLKTLHLPDCSDLTKPVGYSTSIQSLSLMGCIRLQSLDGVCMPNLLELDLSFNPLLRDEGIECLSVMDPKNRGGGGCSHRASAPLLRKLNLRGCDGLQHPRITSSTLEEFDISLCGGLKDIELNCDELRSLEIGMCLALQSFSIDASHIQTLNLSMLPLKRLYIDCKSLQDLKLGGCFAMHDTGIECCKCPLLKSIDIRGTNLTDKIFQNQSGIASLQTLSHAPPEAVEVSAEEKARAGETYRRVEEEERAKKAKTMNVEVHMGGQPPLNWHQMDPR